MYWTVWGESPNLERAHLDGNNRKILITNIGRVQDLTIDYVDRRLYWTDVSDQSIRSSDMNGKFLWFWYDDINQCYVYNSKICNTLEKGDHHFS